VKKYIRDCLNCARYDSAQKSQLLHLIKVKQSFQLIKFDFIDLLSTIFDFNDFYIFHVMNYFSRFFILFLYRIVNAFDVISALQKVFTLYVTSLTIYCDKNQHFNNIEMILLLDEQRIFYSFNSSESSQSTKMIEIENRLLENIFRKFKSQENWKAVLNRFIKSLNDRIVRHLNVSLFMILMKISSNINFSDSVFQTSVSIVSNWSTQLLNQFSHVNMIKRFMKNRRRIQKLILKRFNRKKDKKIDKCQGQ
jgi:hypothetical protein